MRHKLDITDRHTLAELCEVYHAEHPEWSSGYEQNQRAHRKFWLGVFGDVPLTSVAPTDCIRAVHGLTSVGPKTKRHRLRYIQAAYKHAALYLKWIDPSEDLARLDLYIRKLPRPTSTQTYTVEEAQRLLAAAEDADLRICVFAWIAAISGRRPGAIRALRNRDCEYLENDSGVVLTFLAEHDKTGAGGRVYIPQPASKHLQILLGTPAVQTSGFLFPRGDLSNCYARYQVRSEWLRRKWRQVERHAGVPYEKGRAFYGLKRLFATEARHFDPQAASQLSGVSTQTLERVYEQTNSEAKRSLVEHLTERYHGT